MVFQNGFTDKTVNTLLQNKKNGRGKTPLPLNTVREMKNLRLKLLHFLEIGIDNIIVTLVIFGSLLSVISTW